MHPVLFTARVPFIGLVEVSTYRGAYTVAALVAVAVTWWIAVLLGMPRRRTLAAVIVTALGLPVGARLWHMATNWPLYTEEPARAWTLAPTGHALFGGIALAAVVGYASARLAGLDPWRLGDAAAPGLALGLAVMRIGCFCNGCCFGVPTDGPTGVTFPPGSPAHLWQMAYAGVGLLDAPLAAHPTQLYELAGVLACGAVALVLIRVGKRPGIPFLAFIGIFALVRWANWGLRVHPPTLTQPGIYGPIYASVVVLCALLATARMEPVTRRLRALLAPILAFLGRSLMQ